MHSAGHTEEVNVSSSVFFPPFSSRSRRWELFFPGPFFHGRDFNRNTIKVYFRMGCFRSLSRPTINVSSDLFSGPSNMRLLLLGNRLVPLEGSVTFFATTDDPYLNFAGASVATVDGLPPVCFTSSSSLHRHLPTILISF